MEIQVDDGDRAGRCGPATTLAQAHAGGPMISEIDHVRSRHEGLRTMIRIASEQSVTFRRMVDTINVSGGIVYVEPGVCRHGVRACLVKGGISRAARYIFVCAFAALRQTVSPRTAHEDSTQRRRAAEATRILCAFAALRQTVSPRLAHEDSRANEIGRFQRGTSVP